MSEEALMRVRARAGAGSGRALQMPLLILSAGIWVLALSEIGQAWEMVRLASAYGAGTGEQAWSAPRW